jgi:hypothetical protein
MLAETIARALGGRKVGIGWMARCPAHNDREPSLSIVQKEGKVLVRCHAGCDQQDVIEALRKRRIWEIGARGDSTIAGRSFCPPPTIPDADNRIRMGAALAIWQASAPAAGTLVEAYLRSRGLLMSAPPVIRFHQGLKHPSGEIWPAMVALVTRGVDGERTGIHRTFLAYDASGKAPVEPTKMMLGTCRGGAVRLRHSGDVLMIGEGIETCLAAQQASGYPAWAALSTSGLRGLDLPRDVRDVIVLADGDDPGESAAQECAWRWNREGRRVRIARPPKGMDFNDLLAARAASVRESEHER